MRGLCILGMVAVHLVYDLVELYGLWNWTYPGYFTIIKDWGGVAFLLISGICATLGSRSLRRGAVVFGCGMMVTAVTYLADPEFAITFGVLHCLGICMMAWHFLKKMSTKAVAALAALLILLGGWADTISVSFHHLVWLGFRPPNFTSPDYFPLLPNLGFFLAGTVMGKTIYSKKETLLPHFNGDNPLIRFCLFCGRHSLPIYLLHQPVLMGIIQFTAT